MERFVERHKDRIVGVLTGFDRVLFRGTLRSISYLTARSGTAIFLFPFSRGLRLQKR